MTLRHSFNYLHMVTCSFPTVRYQMYSLRLLAILEKSNVDLLLCRLVTFSSLMFGFTSIEYAKLAIFECISLPYQH